MSIYVGYVELRGKKPHWAYQLACKIKNWEKQGFHTQKIICDVKVDSIIAFVMFEKVEAKQ